MAFLSARFGLGRARDQGNGFTLLWQLNPQQLPEFLQQTLHEREMFQIVDHVRHKRFGSGYVIEISGDNLTIQFDGPGSKRVHSNYIREAA